ncbi:MAG TPA: hypothetical protein V6C65_39600 [Allocoleopsis sp.]
MIINALFAGFLMVFALNLAILLSSGETRERTDRKLKRIEFYLELIIDHLELDRFPEELKEMACDPDPRQRLKAISLYRKRTGATLKEAVKAVENLNRNI